MRMMRPMRIEDKGFDLHGCLDELQAFVRSAAGAGMPVHEVERGLWRRLLQLGYQLQSQFFALVGDGDQGDTVTLAEGRIVRRLPEPHSRPYQSVFGEFELVRVVYGTREGQRIEYVPVDARLELPAGKFSYLLQDWDQALAVAMPYQQVNHVLSRLLGWEQSVASLEQMTRTLAAVVDDYRATQPPAPVAEAPQWLVLSGDGKGVPIRKPAAAPPIRAHDHQRGPKPDRKKMALVGAVYQMEPYPRTPHEVVETLFHEPTAPAPVRATQRRPAPPHKRLRASLTRQEGTTVVRAADEIFPWLVAEAQQRDPQQQCPWVVLMDGQPSLWEEVAHVLGTTPHVEILDLLHATGYWWEAVHLFHLPGSEPALKLMKLLVLGLLSGLGTALIPWLTEQAESAGLSPAQRERLAKIGQYFDRNQTRLHYDQYLAAGYPIASGVIEGACRQVVKDRLERTGMHWTVPGAQALLQLRCVALNGEWETFMEHFIQQESKRLYPPAHLIEQAEWPLLKAA
jgi:hypothetical protein